MNLKQVIHTFLHILAIVYVAASQSEDSEVDIVCTELKLMTFKYIGEVETCFSNSTSLTVPNSNINIRSVLHEDGTAVTTDYIEALYIRNSKKMSFLPSGIKESLEGGLKVLRIDNGALNHIDKDDLEPFGSDLLVIQLFNCALTALKGNLFDNNPNLVYIDFERNKLKYIDPQLFKSFQQLEDLEEVDMIDSGCISKKFLKSQGHNFSEFYWSAKCIDVMALIENNERIYEKIKQKIEDKVDTVIVDDVYEIKKELPKLRYSIKEINTKIDEINTKIDKIIKK